MAKELVFSIIIVVTIIIASISVSHFIDGKLNHMMIQLEELENIIDNQGYDEAEKKLEDIHDYWRENEAILSCYVEHDELEKIKTEYTELKAFIKSESDQVYSSLYNMIFIIDHIEQKDDLRIKNIL